MYTGAALRVYKTASTKVTPGETWVPISSRQVCKTARNEAVSDDHN